MEAVPDKIEIIDIEAEEKQAESENAAYLFLERNSLGEDIKGHENKSAYAAVNIRQHIFAAAAYCRVNRCEMIRQEIKHREIDAVSVGHGAGCCRR